MKFTELTVLLPCHSLEDFPVYHEGSQADELLAAWCVLWHPALIASAAAVPGWQRIDILPETLSGRLLAIPPFCLDRLPAGWQARAKNEGAWLVHEQSRDAAVAAALAGLDGGSAGVDDQLAADFLALGFCRLQIELLTRQMRYSTSIDETHFGQEAVSAAAAAVAHDVETARVHLQQCFDTLNEARKHFYPVDVYLLDLTLLAATTLGAGLQRELSAGNPTNLVVPSGLLRQISKDPTIWPQLLGAIDARNLAVLGGEHEERELPLLPLETALAGLREGVDEYEALLGRRPQVYARRRAGLWPVLPQLLTKLAYQGALHFTLDDGRFPLGPQSKIRWEGLDSSVIDVLARLPCDAARSESFLSLSRKLADSMDTDHVATLALAHWPAATSPWYDDLRRIARLSPVLGKFMLLDDYFAHTDMPGRLSKFEPDEYRTPYLKQAIIRRQSDPISTFVRAYREQASQAACATIDTLRDLIVGTTRGQSRARDQCDAPNGPCVTPDISAAAGRLARALPQRPGETAARCLLVNPLAHARQIGVELPRLENLSQNRPVETTASDRKFAVVEVPAMGFAWVDAGGSPSSRAKPIAKDNVLANEFFEATISRATGGVQSLYSFQQRGNQLSQQLAMRLSGSTDAEATYSAMRAESVDTTVSSELFGEIVSRGALVDSAGRRLATFCQTTQAWAGSRLLRILIELDEIEEPRADPWNSYYAARFAWPDESAELSRGVGLARQKTESTRFEAPETINIDNGSGTISILTGGLPYHRRSQGRMLDSLLVVRGETMRKFWLALGVDLPQPAAAALEFITQNAVHFDSGPPPTTPSGWMFHLSAKNVVATHWRPLAGDTSGGVPSSEAPAAVRGFRARLLETAGQSGRVTLRTFRGVAAARQVDFLGDTLVQLSVDHDKISLDFAANEWIEVEAVWS